VLSDDGAGAAFQIGTRLRVAEMAEDSLQRGERGWLADVQT
jgi:hypothetical protein